MPQRILLLWLGCCALAHADARPLGALPGPGPGLGAGPEAAPSTRGASPARAAPASGPAPRCIADDQLGEAAAELLLEGVPPSSERLVEAVRQAGSDAVGVKALLLPAADRDHRARFLASLREREGAELRCGEAFGRDGSLLLAASNAGGLDAVGPGARRLRGWLASGFERPELVVADADGRLQRLELTPEQLSRGIDIADDLRRPARVQLLARGRFGPRPIAERVIAADGGATEAVLALRDEGLPPSERLASMRRSAGSPAVRDNRLLADLAHRHAEGVCAQGRAAHVSADGQDPEQRMQREGLRARRVGEAVARADDVEAAFTALADSPSHRMTLLDRSFTDVGIGRATDPAGRSCLVVMLAAWPRYVGR